MPPKIGSIPYQPALADLSPVVTIYGTQNVIKDQNTSACTIDAVITWVNGNTDAHRQKRALYMAQSDRALHENAINPHRWANNDEILYCLQSIENFAPWTRHIWIVVDDETPNLSSLSAAMRAKIRFMFHAEIFAEYSAVLPTFNSLAIETMLWRIDGLSDRFLYFNDDVFLTAPLHPRDVFDGQRPVLRGDWVDYSQMLHDVDMQQDPSKFNHFMQINAATIAGFKADRLFSSAHVVHPLCRKVMADLFERHADAFVDNIKYRFRDLNQFLPQGLHNHACIAANAAVLHTAEDHIHIQSGCGIGRPSTETWSVLDAVSAPHIKFLCVNDLPQLEAVIPEARTWLQGVIGGFPGLAPEHVSR
ncbi:stealth family protein [Pseudorhodobacter ferrugineus]|uniref:stealth family protein n=1 Tax=Pseudorhodobacter ferrugineus TaxID=77008 RepID=UPI0012DDBC5D